MTDIVERLRSRSPYLHGSSAERTMAEAATEIARLQADLSSAHDLLVSERGVYHETQWRQLEEARAEVERLKANHLSALHLSHEWMAKHDRLLGFIQARPEMLTELIAEEPKP